MSSADKWERKMLRCMHAILNHIKDVRNGLGEGQGMKQRHFYRGREHYWYEVWTCVLARLCESSPTLVPCPQRWISHLLYDQDDNMMEKHLIPDFVLSRVAEARHSARPRTQVLRRWFIHRKTVAIFEIKCYPEDSETGDGVSIALSEARDGVVLQISTYFRSRKGRKAKKVIGIYAAGNIWTWEEFTPNHPDIKPLSRNQDPTYRGSEEPAAAPALAEIPDEDDRNHYRLGEPESDLAMQDMLEAIFGLPDSQDFSED